MSIRNWKLQWQTAKLDTVVEYYVKGFTNPVHAHEYYVDPVKGEIVLKLYVDDPKAAVDG